MQRNAQRRDQLPGVRAVVHGVVGQEKGEVTLEQGQALVCTTRDRPIRSRVSRS